LVRVGSGESPIGVIAHLYYKILYKLENTIRMETICVRFKHNALSCLPNYFQWKAEIAFSE